MKNRKRSANQTEPDGTEEASAPTGHSKTAGKRVERRLQRNRKSAALHRERQKALVDGLVGRVTSLTVERDALRQELERVRKEYNIKVHFPPEAEQPPLVPQSDLEKGVSPDGDGSASALTEKIAALKRDLARKQPHFQVDGVKIDPSKHSEDDEGKTCGSENEEPTELPDFSSCHKKQHHSGSSYSGNNTSDAESMHSSDSEITGEYATARAPERSIHNHVDLSSHLKNDHFSGTEQDETRSWRDFDKMDESGDTLEEIPEGEYPDHLSDVDFYSNSLFNGEELPFLGNELDDNWNGNQSSFFGEFGSLSPLDVVQEEQSRVKRARMDNTEDLRSHSAMGGRASGVGFAGIFPAVIFGLACLVCLASLPTLKDHGQSQGIQSYSVGERSLMSSVTNTTTVSQPLLDLLQITEANSSNGLEQLNAAISRHGRNYTASGKNGLRGTKKYNNAPAVFQDDTNWKNKAFLSGSVHGQDSARALSQYLVDFLNSDDPQFPQQGELLEHFVPEQHITDDNDVSFSQLHTDAALWSYSTELLSILGDSDIVTRRQREALKKSLVPFQSSEELVAQSSEAEKCPRDTSSNKGVVGIPFRSELVRRIGRFAASSRESESEGSSLEGPLLRFMVPDNSQNESQAVLFADPEFSEHEELKEGSGFLVPFEGNWYDLTCRIEKVSHRML
eukprot:gb/GECG01004105.1/.p1 GENE.gb/GECG01004105.1/~~gb/GECG01004105.1/.p1  ORF type:complete len:678 (+),score=117.99 gb/GECG01004105.1/:1-2034(+)